MPTFTAEEIEKVSSDPTAHALDDFRHRCDTVAAELRLKYRWSDADQRIFAVHQLRNVMQSVTAMYLFGKVVFPAAEFWTAFFGARPSPQDLRNHEGEFEMMVKFSALHSILSVLESDVRLLVRTIDPTACDGARSAFLPLSEWLLARAKTTSGFKDLLRLAALTRNTIHNNGVHQPHKGGSCSVTWNGWNYEFVAGKPIEFADIRFAVTVLPNAVLDFVEAIVTDPVVADLPRS